MKICNDSLEKSQLFKDVIEGQVFSFSKRPKAILYMKLLQVVVNLKTGGVLVHPNISSSVTIYPNACLLRDGEC